MPYGAGTLFALLIAALLGVAAVPGGGLADTLPSNQSGFDVFKTTLKQEGGRFLFNGYWMSEDELRAARANAADAANNIRYERPVPELPHPDLSLNVNIVNGRLDYWVQVGDRVLSYAIDKSSMTAEEYAILQKDMAEATADWVNACPQCGISFPHTAELDDAPDLDKVKFIIRNNRKNDFPGLLGWSFFPSSPKEQRILVITPSFFGKENIFSRAGILRHQIGHILGYRHAHVSPLAGPGCFKEGGQAFFGAKYDPKSVMHYLCGGGGTKDMKLSKQDIASHQLLYGFATIQVDIDGKDVFKTAAELLSALTKQYNRLVFQPYNIDLLEGCQAYIDDLGLAQAWRLPVTAAACSVFTPLARKESGRTQLPVLLFNSYMDVASGAFLENDSVARKEVEDLLQRVGGKVEINRSSGRDRKLVNYLVEWRRYRANIPVSPLEVEKVWPALDTASKANDDVSVSLDASIGRSLAVTTVKRNSVSTNPRIEFKHPVDDSDEICKRPDRAGHYAMVQGYKPDVDANGLPYLKCDYPSTDCQHCSPYQPRSFIIDESLDEHALKPRPTADPAKACEWTGYGDQHHGTLMGQILAGSNKFFGFNPSLQPKLITNSTATTTQTRFDDEARSYYAQDPQRRGVALITSQLCYPRDLLNEFGVPGGAKDCEILGHDRTDKPEYRDTILGRHLPTTRLKSARNWLWVAAMGQPKGVENVHYPPPTTTFDKDSFATPVALAQSSFVMLVTACEKCSIHPEHVKERKVWSRAYRGTGKFRPHVMAPGGVDFIRDVGGTYVGGLPGFGQNHALMRAFGTSQSAAYVSGLAAKMLACYSTYYQTPGDLKAALQFTSMPVQSESNEPDVATGLVDVGAALRNPGFVYLKSVPGGDKEFERIKREDFRWCTNGLKFRIPEGGETSINAEHIRRIVSTSTNRWMVYQIKPDSLGVVERSPLVSGLNLPGDGKTIFMNGSKELKLSQVKDLLLFDHPGEVDCPEPKK